jgi:multicomponent Na+:H+ antiporter subunit F
MILELPALVLHIAQGILSLSILLCLYRIVRGPTPFDRALALDLIGLVAIAAIAVFSIQMHTLDYFPVILVIAILGFFGLMAVSKYLLRGDIIDRDN